MSDTPQSRIVAWCRKRDRAGNAVQPVMRTRPDGTCVLIDLGQSEPKPGGYKWEHRDKVLAEGSDWQAIEIELVKRGWIS